VVGVLALLAGSAFQITAWLPDLNGWGTTAILVALLALAAATVHAWSARPGWTGGHALALAIGALTTYTWHAFVEHPVVSATPAVDLTGDLVFGLGAALLAVLAVRRQASLRRAEPPAAKVRSGTVGTVDTGLPDRRTAR
jgi:glycerol-3-phosphate acyltransferase PlsY